MPACMRNVTFKSHTPKRKSLFPLLFKGSPFSNVEDVKKRLLYSPKQANNAHMCELSHALCGESWHKHRSLKKLFRAPQSWCNIFGMRICRKKKTTAVACADFYVFPIAHTTLAFASLFCSLGLASLKMKRIVWKEEVYINNVSCQCCCCCRWVSINQRSL
jgi:hypothetical protein